MDEETQRAVDELTINEPKEKITSHVQHQQQQQQEEASGHKREQNSRRLSININGSESSKENEVKFKPKAKEIVFDNESISRLKQKNSFRVTFTASSRPNITDLKNSNNGSSSTSINTNTSTTSMMTTTTNTSSSATSTEPNSPIGENTANISQGSTPVTSPTSGSVKERTFSDILLRNLDSAISAALYQENNDKRELNRMKMTASQQSFFNGETSDRFFLPFSTPKYSQSNELQVPYVTLKPLFFITPPKVDFPPIPEIPEKRKTVGYVPAAVILNQRGPRARSRSVTGMAPDLKKLTN